MVIKNWCICVDISAILEPWARATNNKPARLLVFHYWDTAVQRGNHFMGEKCFDSSAWIHVSLLDFALELRLANSHRFADYCPNVETLPRGERRGEEKEAQRGEGGRWSAHTCSILCTCHNTAQHCDVCLSWSFHQETAPLGILLSQSQLFVSKPQATLLRNRFFWNFLYNKQGKHE